MRIALASLSAIMAWMPAVSAADTDWATVRGRFVLEGKLDGLRGDAVVVNSRNRGLANVVVMLRSRDEVPVHWSYKLAVNDDVLMEVKRRAFRPRVAPVWGQQRLMVHNADTQTCIPYLAEPTSSTQRFILEENETAYFDFHRSWPLPVALSCATTAAKRGYVVVTDHPYVAISDKNGRFQLTQCPVGSWVFQTWHEKAGRITAVKRKGRREDWDRGRFEVEVPPNGVDLGAIVLRSKLMKR